MKRQPKVSDGNCTPIAHATAAQVRKILGLPATGRIPDPVEQLKRRGPRVYKARVYARVFSKERLRQQWHRAMLPTAVCRESGGILTPARITVDGDQIFCKCCGWEIIPGCVMKRHQACIEKYKALGNDIWVEKTGLVDLFRENDERGETWRTIAVCSRCGERVTDAGHFVVENGKLECPNVLDILDDPVLKQALQSAPELFGGAYERDGATFRKKTAF